MTDRDHILVEGSDPSSGERWTANYGADGWAVENGFLHIFTKTPPLRVATYAPAYWNFVSRREAEL